MALQLNKTCKVILMYSTESLFFYHHIELMFSVSLSAFFWLTVLISFLSEHCI